MEPACGIKKQCAWHCNACRSCRTTWRQAIRHDIYRQGREPQRNNGAFKKGLQNGSFWSVINQARCLMWCALAMCLGQAAVLFHCFKSKLKTADRWPWLILKPSAFSCLFPEAVQLVLQASTLNESNAIFMLEMGDPIKNVDLAKNLIELSD